MRPNPLQRRRSAQAPRRPHSRRPLLELLESRVVPSLTAKGGYVFNTAESTQLTNITVATGAGSPNKAIIDWGDTTTSPGTIVFNGNGGFTVLGTHTYLELPGQGDLENEQDAIDTFTITVTISNSTSVQVTDTANVAEEGVVIGPPRITSVSPGTVQEGSGSFTLFVFGTGFVPGATVQWSRNGTTNLLTTVDSSTKLQAVVPASLLTEESNSVHGIPTITVVQPVNSSTQTSNSVNFTITEAPIVATGGLNITGTAGQAFTTTVATFTNTGGPENPNDTGDYNATINWGDNTSSSGSISLSGNVFTVTGSHTYANSGTFTVTVTINHETVSATVTSTATIGVPPLISPTITSLSPGSVPEGSGSFTLFVFGTGFAPGATVQWSRNGTTNLQTTFDSSSKLQAVVPASLLTEESNSIHGVPTITVVQTVNGSTKTSNSVNFTITEAPIVATGGLSITGTVGQAFTTKVATFTNTGGPENPNDTGDYNATINWGDNTTSSGSISLSGNVFTVTGSHTYASSGTFTVTVTINHETVSATVTDTVVVSPQVLIATGGLAIQAIEGQSFTAVVATFTGSANKATIDWGDGTTSAGTISGPNGNGVFTVSGTHTYKEESNTVHGGTPFTITVTISNQTTAVVKDQAFVAEAPLSATGGSTINAVAGQSFTATVATFVDTGGPENPNDTGDYNATINWGDNTSSSGTISLSGNVFTVTGSHTYAGTGTFTVTVTINHETVSATVTDTVVVSPLPLVTTGGFVIQAVEGQPFTAVVATFTGSANKATIDWGDGTTSAGTISGPNSNGVFTVSGSHTYTEESNSVHGGNPFTITVTISNQTTAVVTDQAFVAEAPIVATGVTLNAVEGQAFTSTVATFVDTGGPENAADPGDYTAVINWDDGTVSNGTISGPDQNGVFSVTGSHTYTEEVNPIHGGPFNITVSIVHETVSATATSTAVVAEAPLAATGGFTITATPGQSFTTTVATFVDTGGPENANDPGDYNATIDWGDGTTSAGTISGPDSNGAFTVTGSQTYASSGTFNVTVTINHETTSAVVTDTASVAAANAAMAGFATSITATQFMGADFLVAQFTDTDASVPPGSFTATIDWGDGTQPDQGNITQPGGPGTPLFVDFMHAYNDVGTFTVHVHITDSFGASIDVFSTAIVNGAGAPQGPGGGNATSSGKGLVEANQAQATSRQLPHGAVATNSSGVSTPSQVSGADQSGRANRAAELYWQLFGQGDEFTSWVADQLAPAVAGTAS